MTGDSDQSADSPVVPSADIQSQAAGGWLKFIVLTAVVSAFLFVRDALHTGSALSIAGEAIWGRDFVNVYTSGTLTLRGRLDLLYDVSAYQSFQEDLFDGALRYHLFSYPPAVLLYTWLFAILPYPLAWIVWIAGTGTLFVLAARPYLGEVGLPNWIAVVAPASVINIWAGHYGFLMGALWLFAWSNLARRPALAGVLVGFMIVKPHLAVLLPIVLVWRRQWIAFAAAAATVLAIIALTSALFGSELWIIYLTETVMLHAEMVDDVGTFFLTFMPTVMPSLSILGIPLAPAAVVQALVALGTLAILLRRMPASDRDAGLAVATATFLVLPYAFAYDMTVAGLAGLILFRSSLSGSSRRFALFAGAAAFVPMAVMFLNLVRLPVAPLLITFQLLAMLRLLDRPKPRSGVSAAC